MGLVIRSLMLTVIAAVAGLAVNAVRADGVSLSGFAPPTVCEAPAGVTPRVIDPADAAHECGRGDIVIADARGADAYAAGHIAGAVHLPCNAGGQAVADTLRRLGVARTIVVYGSTTEEALPVAAGIARGAADGPTVLVIRGGFAAWEAAGLACASGPCDRCEEHRHP